MRIVHIEEFFHPDAGYQINFLAKYLAAKGHEVIIVTADMEKMPDEYTSFFGKDNIKEKDEQYTKNTGVKVYRLPLFAYFSGRAIFKFGMRKLIDSLRPDILYVHGNDTLTGILYIWKAGKLPYPIITDSHMVEMASINPLNKLFRLTYKNLVAPVIKKRNLTVIRVVNDDYIKKCLGIPLEQAPFISFGADLSLFRIDFKERESFRKEHNITNNDFVVVYTGKLDESKGGKLLANAFEQRFINKRNKNVVLIVVGNTSGEYGKEIEAMFLKSCNRIIRFQTQKYIDLHRFYKASDLCVFPKQCSLSFFDAQACGLPVISENNNVNLNRLQYQNGFTFKIGDIEDFREKILSCIEMDDESFSEMRYAAYNYVKDNFNYEDIANQYEEIILQVVSNYTK